MTDSPWERAQRRSAILSARRPSDASDGQDGQGRTTPKLPLGHEPAPGSADWGHRCGVLVARLRPPGDRPLTLHEAGMPRPRTPDGWPVPFAGKDAANPCATELGLELLCCRSQCCQLCGLALPSGSGYAVRRPGQEYVSRSGVTVPWVEGRAMLHLACLRFSMRYCPELVRQLRQGVAHVVREPTGASYTALDGVMLDTREYLGFIEPVWHLEVARDSEAAVESLRQLKQAAAMNARATAVLFPWLVAATKGLAAEAGSTPD